MRGWLYFPSQVRYLCGIYISDGANDAGRAQCSALALLIPQHTGPPNPVPAPPGSPHTFPQPCRFPGTGSETLSAIPRRGFSAPKGKILPLILPVPGTKARHAKRNRAAGALQQIRVPSALLHSQKAQLRLKRINGSFPQTVFFPLQLGSGTPRVSLLLREQLDIRGPFLAVVAPSKFHQWPINIIKPSARH